jgi:hypothetical protein
MEHFSKYKAPKARTSEYYYFHNEAPLSTSAVEKRYAKSDDYYGYDKHHKACRAKTRDYKPKPKRYGIPPETAVTLVFHTAHRPLPPAG